jgi:hypothetical protein
MLKTTLKFETFPNKTEILIQTGRDVRVSNWYRFSSSSDHRTTLSWGVKKENLMNLFRLASKGEESMGRR